MIELPKTPHLGLPLNTYGSVAADRSLKEGFAKIDDAFSRVDDEINNLSAGTNLSAYRLSNYGFSPSETAANNLTALTNAITAANTAGGGHIVVDKPGRFQLAPLNLTGAYKNVRIEATEGVTLVADGVNHLANQGLLRFNGSVGQTTTLAVSCALGDSEIAVANGTLLQAGQMVRIYSDTEYWNGLAGVGGFGVIVKQELNFIKSISGNTITLLYPTSDSYSVEGYTVTVAAISPVENITFENFLLEGGGELADLTNGNGQYGIITTYAKNIRAINVNGLGWQGAVGVFRNTWRSQVCEGELYGLADREPTDCFYGWVGDGAYYMDVSRVKGRFMRRVADTNVNFVSRFVRQFDNRAEDMNGSGFGSHHGQFVSVYNNDIRVSGTAISMRAKDSVIAGNRIRTSGYGIPMYCGDTDGTLNESSIGSIHVVGNSIVSEDGTGSSMIRVNSSTTGAVVAGNVFQNINGVVFDFRGTDLKSLSISGNSAHYSEAASSSTDFVVIHGDVNVLRTAENIDIAPNVLNGFRGNVLSLHSPVGGNVLNNIAVHRQACNRPILGNVEFVGTPARGDNIYIDGEERLAQCRISLSSGNILLTTYNGNQLYINGRNREIPSSSVTLNATGLVANTEYFLYAYVDAASNIQLEASTTAWSTAFGWPIKSGDASRTLVGWVKTNGSAGFTSTETQRLVSNYWNRRSRRLKRSISANRSFSLSSITESNSADRVEFYIWSNGEAVTIHGQGQASISANTGYIGLGIGGTVVEGSASLVSTNLGNISHSVVADAVSSPGYNFVSPVGYVSTTGSMTLVGGGANGQAYTMSGWVMA